MSVFAVFFNGLLKYPLVQLLNLASLTFLPLNLFYLFGCCRHTRTALYIGIVTIYGLFCTFFGVMCKVESITVTVTEKAHFQFDDPKKRLLQNEGHIKKARVAMAMHFHNIGWATNLVKLAAR